VRRQVIASIGLRHFRSHRRVDLEFDGRPVAIFGPNGAGKTNLIEAISLLSPGRGLRRATAEEFIRRPEALGWKIVASLGSGQDIETWAEPGAGRQVRVDDKAQPQVALGKLVRLLWLVPSMDRLWIEGADGRRRFLDRAALSLDPGHADAVLTYERAMRERNRLLKDMVRDAHWYTALEAQMAASGDMITQGRRAAISALMSAQAAAGDVFPASELSLSHAEGDLPDGEDALRVALAKGRMRDLSAGRTLIGPHRCDLEAVWKAKDMAARDCSTGEQKALLISLILANVRALGEDSPRVLLLDEVAAHLDAGRRAALYEEIRALGVQAFMTGTGPELFEDLGPAGQFLEVKDENGESTVRYVD
jgi:DNA replication and repair protein RecF